MSEVTRPPYARHLSDALAATATVAGVLTYAFPDELGAPPVMTGSARGTALVLVVVAVPLLVIAPRLAGRGSTRAVVVWFGTAMYTAYNAVLLALGTPLNRFFLLYVCTLALAIAVSVAVAVTATAPTIAQRCSPGMPRRVLAGYLLVIVALNVVAWLGRIVPAMVDDDMARLLAGTGLSMVPTYLQDLAFWLPLVALGAVWLWQGRPWGYLLAGGSLVMWVIEGVTVATDQWFGHRADPGSDLASPSAVILFGVLAVVGGVMAWVFLRHVDASAEGSRTS